MTPTTTMDPTVRGNQHRGPARWARAKQWAEAKPHTKQGRTYLARVAAAEEMERRIPGQRWQHWRDQRYDGQTCSTYCAVLELQVGLQCAGLEELDERLKSGDRRSRYARAVERPANSKRSSACLTCGKKVGPAV